MDDLSILIRETAILHLSDLATLPQSNSTALISLKSPHVLPPSDESIAFSLYAKELESLELITRDFRLATSLTNALEVDVVEIERLVELDRIHMIDRDLALRLNRGEALPRVVDRIERTPGVISIGSVPPSTALSSSNRTSETQSNSKTLFPTPSIFKPIKYVECVICGDRKKEKDTIQVPCAHLHHYDVDCLKALFLAATNDESLFPPRCDGVNIPFQLIQNHLTFIQLRKFNEKSIEFLTLRRLYCSTLTCSKFLGSLSTVKSAIRCTQCGESSCSVCGGKWHGLFGMCSGGNDNEVIEGLQRDFEYQRCPGCRRIVELNVGCYHMTCLCRQEFCYLCAAPWRNCTCPQWEEGRLIQQAREVVAARAEDEPLVAPEVHERRVRREVEELRVNHQCAHNSWALRHGANQCQVCFHNLGRYLLRCNNCMMMACVRCQRNRL